MDVSELEPLLLRDREIAKAKSTASKTQTALKHCVSKASTYEQTGQHCVHGCNLNSNTRDHNVGARIRSTAIRRCSNSSSNSLNDNAESITGNEDPSIQFRLKTRVLWAQSHDNVLQGEVDAGGEEGRCDDEAHDLDLEADPVPRVVVHHTERRETR